MQIWCRFWLQCSQCSQTFHFSPPNSWRHLNSSHAFYDSYAGKKLAADISTTHVKHSLHMLNKSQILLHALLKYADSAKQVTVSLGNNCRQSKKQQHDNVNCGNYNCPIIIYLRKQQKVVRCEIWHISDWQINSIIIRRSWWSTKMQISLTMQCHHNNCKSKVNQFVERCQRAVDTYQLSQPI